MNIYIYLSTYIYILFKYALDDLCYLNWGPKSEYNP